MATIDCGISISCSDEAHIGGVKRVFVINRDALADTAFNKVSGEHAYDNYTTVGSSATATNRWHEIELYDETGVFTGTGELGDAGNSVISNEITGFIPVMEKVKALCLNKIKDSCKVVALVQTMEGQAFVIGYDETIGKKAALRAQISLESGTAFTDRQGYTITMTGTQFDVPYEYEGSIIVTDGSTITFS